MLHLLIAILAARAEEGARLEAAWRPTLRRAYVLYGASSEQIPLPGLVAGQEPSSEAGIVTSRAALGRFEASVSYPVREDLRGFARVMGGGLALRFYPEQALQEGTDWNFDVGGTLRHPVGGRLAVETSLGGRARVWAFEGEETPTHGNVGLILAVRPEYAGWSLLVESTLAAVWLTDLTAWGAQKDSSILRIRPEYAWTSGPLRLTAGLEYYHTHTELFGTELIPGQSAFMLDDFELAFVAGAGLDL